MSICRFIPVSDSSSSGWVYLAGMHLVWFSLFFPPSVNEISSSSETVSHIRAREAIYCCRMHLQSVVSLSLSV